MEFLQGSKGALNYVAETVFGTTPTTPAMKASRFLIPKFGMKRNTLQSKENRSDRQIAAIKYGTKQGSIDLPFELSYGAFDDFLSATLGGAWATDILKTGNTLSSFTMEHQNTEMGLYEYHKGVTFNGMQLSVKPDAIVTGSFSCLAKDQQVIEAIGVSVTINIVAKTITRASGSFITDGFVTGLNYGLQGMTNAGNNTAVFTNVTVAALTLTYASVTGTPVAEGPTTATVHLDTLGAPSAAATNAPYDTFTGALNEGGTALAIVTGVDLSFQNNLSSDFTLFADSAQHVSQGRIVLTGNLSCYVVNQQLKKKFLNGTASTLDFTLGGTSAGAKGLKFSMSNVMYTGHDRNQDEGSAIETLPFQAIYNATDAGNLTITRYP